MSAVGVMDTFFGFRPVPGMEPVFPLSRPRRLELSRTNCGFSLYNATDSNMSASRGAVNRCVPWLLRQTRLLEADRFDP
ncbi:hypothetical protein NQ318_011575 [Aromia moschata]|uniref:Uncharacterized protein n=1 Tax=Aromia moschata TaxID=1265417 RepID=A0AAV8Z6K2_9CUCU|nr:hypothetical protein NQ318_011575 [Aromia moschata]